MKSELAQVAKEIKNLNYVIRVISHLDTDGITSAAIISKALKRENKLFCLSIIKQLSEELLEILKKEVYDIFIFTDLGAGQLENIIKFFPEKRIIILDHHEYDKKLKIPKNITLINPHKYGIDGSKDISGAGVVYLFATALNAKNKDLSHLAILGAIGDVQTKFSSLHNEILDIALSLGLLKKEKTLNWYGIESRPIIRNMIYGDIELPGIENESDAVMFLESIGIEPKLGENWKSFADLNDEEKQKLISGIIMKRKELENPQDIFTERLITKDKGQFKDLKELSTLLNACGRLDKASYGIGACLNDKYSKAKALETVAQYRKEVSDSLRWYKDNEDKIIKTKKYILINAKNNIRPTIIGTLASIISNDKELDDKTIIISMARDKDNSKVSVRIKGEFDIDLRDIVKEILTEIEGEGGGHKNAAGAIISKDQEEDFIKQATQVLDNLEF